jgi:hypothetical protein
LCDSSYAPCCFDKTTDLGVAGSNPAGRTNNVMKSFLSVAESMMSSCYSLRVTGGNADIRLALRAVSMTMENSQQSNRPSFQDKRNFFRIRTVLSVCIGLEKETQTSLTVPMSVYISGGGIGFMTTKDYKIGKIGDVLTITISLSKHEIIRAKAQVVNRVPVQHKHDEFHIGTCFSEITQRDQEVLIQYILRLQAERLKTHYSA